MQPMHAAPSPGGPGTPYRRGVWDKQFEKAVLAQALRLARRGGEAEGVAVTPAVPHIEVVEASILVERPEGETLVLDEVR